LYWDLSPVAEFVNHYQTKLTLYFLEMGLEKGQLQGIDIWINPHYKVIVTKACNGTIPILVLLAAILAYPIDWVHKLWWAVIGYLVLTTINIIRLLMVAHFVKVQPDFPLYHDLFGNILLMITGLLLFYLFLRGTRAYRLTR
jgi:exosortase/archaeosortase family protein